MTKGRRLLKQEVLAKAASSSREDFLEFIKQYPEKVVVHALFSGLCRGEERTKWHAVYAFGQVMARLADQDMEQARIIMRRFMWMLNDESGGIGWGVPEAFAEVLACHDGLAREYTHIFISFMRPDGFYLELEPLQRGLLWGMERLAQSRPELLGNGNAGLYLLSYLDSPDNIVREYAARVLNLLQANN